MHFFSTSTRLSGLLLGLLLLVLALAIYSLNVGASSMKLLHLFTDPDDRITRVLFASRLPRTLALILAGSGLAVAGLLMQLLARNPFVEPASVGSFSAASLGMLVCMAINPAMGLELKFVLVAAFAAVGTFIFLRLINSLPQRSSLLVPLVGLVFAAVVMTAAQILAAQFELGAALKTWSSGDFSAILRGRYEILWLAAGLTLVAILLASQLLALGLGKDLATNLGLNYSLLFGLAVIIIALITASLSVTAGVLPFIGLLAPNLVRWLVGDKTRLGVILTALVGAVFMLVADLAGRLILHPYEVPSANLLAIGGSFIFLVILIRGRSKWA